MPVFTCKNFKGHNPVGVGAVMVATSRVEAAQLLSAALADRGLVQIVEPNQMVWVDPFTKRVNILTDGEY